jgi:hypothetical protein
LKLHEYVKHIFNFNYNILVHFLSSTCPMIQGGRLWYHCVVVAKVRERLAVNKQRSQTFNIEMLNLKKVNELEGEE